MNPSLHYDNTDDDDAGEFTHLLLSFFVAVRADLEGGGRGRG